MPIYYSQNGEDFLLNEIFKNKENGFFVEVGCIDGRRFSNTLLFEEKGWSGLCIEAHSDYIELLKKNRPNSKVIHCAAGEKDEEKIPFYANLRGSLSTVDSSKEEEFKKNYKEYFTGFEKQYVPKKTLNTIFKENHLVTNIDILSIDVEGYEVEVLQGLDLSHYKPSVIVIESDSREHEKRLNKILSSFGYKLILRLGVNLFYSTDVRIKKKVHNKIFRDIELLHTGNPLDEENDQRKKVTIDTRFLARKKRALISFARLLYNKCKDFIYG